jgi:hypothetical protein
MAVPQSPSTLDNNLTTGGTNAQGLSDWAAPYITNYLGQTQALAQQPYQVYGGPLTAGPSELQTQGFGGLAGLTVPSAIGQAAGTAGDIAGKYGNLSYTPTTTTFGVDQAQQYMNPYLQSALNPQLDEARRQAMITQTQNAGKMTQAGAFGGGRQAIMDSENQRNLGTTLANITGQGYNTAYTNAQQQFNADQARQAQEAQFGANYGLQGLAGQLGATQAQAGLGNMQNQANLSNINAQLAGGNTQRGITSEGVAADVNEFNQQRQYPYQQIQFQRDMISGLPVSSVSNTPGSLTGIGSLLSSLGGGAAVASGLGYKNTGDLLKALGLDLTPPA